jgi:hypothetical protein
MSAASFFAVALTASVAAPEASWPPTPPPPRPVTTSPAPAIQPQPVRVAVSDAELHRRGNRMILGAGLLFTAGAGFNLARAFVASGTCQERGQPRCTGSWLGATSGAWLTNLPAIALVATGGDSHGRADGHEAGRRRKQTMRVVGPIVGALGLVTNLGLRLLWIHDYATPRDRQAFDFARRSDAMFYYGGLQVGTMAAAAGLAMTVYGNARATSRRVSAGPMLDRTTTGIMVRGRF